MARSKEAQLSAARRWRRSAKGRATLHRWYEKQKGTASAEKKRQATRDANLRREFGITLDEYERLATAQNDLCAICGEPETYRHQKDGRTKRLAVDHDHETGIVRALLCHACNVAIGYLDEDSALLRRAADYLDSHRQGVLHGV